MRSLALILSMTAPVPPAHLSFIDGIFFFRPVSGSVLEDDDLGVLAAELDDRAALGVELLDRQRDGVDFLHELRADALRDAVAAGAGDEHAGAVGRKPRMSVSNALEELEHFSGCLVSWRW